MIARNLLWACCAGLAFGGAAMAADKTLVSWVCLANTVQQGGSALTIQCGGQFDGIVLGEKVAGKWMAGSDGFTRTQTDQERSPVETAGPTTLIQMAVVYRGNNISIYRNGEPCASYEASNADLLSPLNNNVVFGLRHQGLVTNQTLQGSIADARIYDRALSAEELKKLEPKKESSIKPYAWWTFEKGSETDRTGRFPVNRFKGGARIKGGRLILDAGGAALHCFRRLHSFGETPAMPATPPDHWPTFHLLHPGPGNAIPGDPNCAFFWKGVYHLHYIYDSGGFCFAHLSSTDLVHWKWHPTTLTPRTTGHGMFSGTGFITKEGKPAIIYHGQGTEKNQIAVAEDDELEEWRQPVAMDIREPTGEPSAVRQWDPDCWLNGDTYYAISGGSPPHLMKSKDLKTWTNLGLLFHDQMPAAALKVNKDEDVSCPNMFKIGKKWMLLCISHPLGCRYYLGGFKEEEFLPEFHAMMSWNGNTFFAPESVLTKDGRRVMWSWLLNLPVAPTGIQSLPRELELPEDGVLRIRPLRELEVLRGGKKEEKKITLTSEALYAPKDIGGNAIELEVSFEATKAKEFGLDVLCDARGANGMHVAYLPESKTLRVGAVSAPFELKKDEELTLRIFVDKNLVEVFANDRQAALSAAAYAPANLGIRLMSKGGDTMVRSLKCWTMKSIYTAPNEREER